MSVTGVVKRYDSATNEPISTYIVVGKYVKKGQTAPFNDFKVTNTSNTLTMPYLTSPNSNLYAIEIYNDYLYLE